MSDLTDAATNLSNAATRANKTTDFFDDVTTLGPTSTVKNPNNNKTVPSVQKQVKDLFDSLPADDSVDALQAAAIAVGAKYDEVIATTDTTTVLDDVLYIYDASEQTTYSKPYDVGIGEVIVSVVGGNLTTDAGVYALNLVVNGRVNKTNAEILTGTPAIGELWHNTTDNTIHMGNGVTLGGIKHVNVNTIGNLTNYEAASVADALVGQTVNGAIDLVLGQRWVVGDYYGDANPNNSGVLFFKVVASGTGTADGGKYIDVPNSLFQLEQNLQLPIKITAFAGRGDGVINNSPYLINALTCNSSSRVEISGGTSGFVFDDDVTLPVGKSIIGDYVFVDPRFGELFNDTNYPSRVLLSSSASFILKEAASIKGIPILRKDLVMPTNAAGVALFAGSAIKISPGESGQYIGHCAIVGFNVAVEDDVTQNTEQWRCEYLNIDCTNGILAGMNFDIVYIENVHCWPATTVGYPGVVDADLQRAGTAFRFKDGGDWNRWANCFSFGYQNGFVNDGCNSVIAAMCGADYTVSQTTNPIGYSILNDAAEMKLVATQAAGQGISYYINSTATNNHVELVSTHSWEANTHHVLNASGQVFINGGRFRGGPASGVTPNDDGPTILSAVSFESIGGPAINNQSSASVVRWDSNCTFRNCATINVNAYLPFVNSADPLVLNNEDLVFSVLGTVSFGSLNYPLAYAGKIVTLIFNDVLTVFDGGNMNLSGTFVTSASDTLTLQSVGSAWVEISRSTN